MEHLTKEKAVAATPTALSNRQSNPSKFRHKSQSNLDKSKLIAPSIMLDTLGIRYQPSIAGLAVYCPFHKSGKEHNPSLLMHSQDGHYRCFTCGANRGDVIAFYRAVTGAGFMEALKVLGV